MQNYNQLQLIRPSDGNYSDPSQPNYRPIWWSNCVNHWQKTLHWTGDLGDVNFKNLYLTEVPGEFPEDRNARVYADSPEPYFKDSVNDHASLFSQFAIEDDAPASLIESQDNVDLEGSDLWQWSIDPLTALFRDGGCLMGADIGRAVSLGDRRPRLIMVPLRDVYWVEYRNIDGVDTLARLSIRRTFNVQKTDGTLQIRERYFVYELDENQQCNVTQWEENDQGKLIEGDPVPFIGADGQPLNRLPFTDKLSVIKNLKIDLEHKILSVFAAILELNHEHYNSKSEYNTVKRKTALPTLVRYWEGGVPETPPPAKLGPGRAMDMNAGSEATFLELNGDSLPSLRTAIEDIEKKISKRDNKLFHTGGIMSATEADIENQKSKVSLPKFKKIIESAYQDLFSIWELLSNRTPDDVGGIVIDDSVLETPPQAADMMPYIQAIDRGIPVDAVIKAMLRKGLFVQEDFEGVSMAQPSTEQLPTDPNEEII